MRGSRGDGQIRRRSRAPLVLFVPRLDHVEHAIQTPAHLRDPLGIAAAMRAVEIAQQSKRQRRILKHHSDDERCIIVGGASPCRHASATVLSHDGRERFKGAAWLVAPNPTWVYLQGDDGPERPFLAYSP